MEHHEGAPDDRARSWQALVVAQDGVLARRQALRGGLTEDEWQWRLDASRWQPLLRGVVATHTGPVTSRQQAWAAVLASGQGACLSGDAALTLLGMPLGDLSVVHVAVPEDRVVVSRLLTPPGAPSVRIVPRRVSGLPVLLHPSRRPPTVRVETAVLHAAAWAATDRAAEWRVAAAVQQRHVSVPALRQALTAMPRVRRHALVATVLDDVEHGAQRASWTSCASCDGGASLDPTAYSVPCGSVASATSMPGGSASAWQLSSTAPPPVGRHLGG